MAVVIGSSMGTLFFLGICLLIAAIVIINVNDYQNWKKYQVGWDIPKTIHMKPNMTYR